MQLTAGKIVLICSLVLVVLVLMLVFIFTMPTGSEIGHMVSDALGRDNLSQTSVQVCAGFINIGSCRSAQTQSNGWRVPSGNSGGFGSMPVLLILAAGGLSVWFLALIGIYLFGSVPSDRR